MNTSEIWNILGISETEDEASIRRAYALRLRQTHPEDDADGFKQLRAAYDAALQRAKWAKQQREWRAEPDTGDDQREDNHGEAWGSDDPLIANRDREVIETGDETVLLRRQIEADIEEHNRARRALFDAINESAPFGRILDALHALLATRAMNQIDVHANTSAWLIEVVHQHRPVSEILIDPMIEFFGWTVTAEAGSHQEWRTGRRRTNPVALHLRHERCPGKHTSIGANRLLARRRRSHRYCRELFRPSSRRDGAPESPSTFAGDSSTWMTTAYQKSFHVKEAPISAGHRRIATPCSRPRKMGDINRSSASRGPWASRS